MKLRKLLLVILHIGLCLCSTSCVSYKSSKTVKDQIIGESLVLTGNKPGKLCFEELVRGSVIVRSTYLSAHSNSKIYTEGIDYFIDYANGEIVRTDNSSIPDYSNHPLFGQKNFDHSKWTDYANHPYFIWVDYLTTKGKPFAKPNDQSSYLVGFRKKLETGTPLNIVSYGNSITAGGEASVKELRFQYRYVDYLETIFPKAKISIEDVSIPGHLAHHGIEKWDDYIGKTSPDLVLLGWGMNDHNIGGNSPEQYKAYLIQLVKMIKEKKNSEVIIFSSFPPNDNWSFGSHRMELYSEAAKQAAFEASCAYVDVYSVWIKVLQRKDQSSLLGNNINHPNDFGHWLYLQAFEAMLF